MSSIQERLEGLIGESVMLELNSATLTIRPHRGVLDVYTHTRVGPGVDVFQVQGCDLHFRSAAVWKVEYYESGISIILRS